MKPSKCAYFQRKVKFVGHIVSGEDIRPDTEYVQIVRNMVKPNTQPRMSRFLGMVNYLMKFLPLLSKWTKPLNEAKKLASKKAHGKIVWTQKAEEAWDKLQEVLLNYKPLRLIDPNKKFFIQCDASKTAMGAVLLQEDEEGNLHPVEFASKGFDETQQRWHCSHQELYSVIWAILKWSHWLRPQHFHIANDHKNLVTWINKASTGYLKNAKISRWLLLLQDYNFDIGHISGKDNIPADYLSRDINWNMDIPPLKDKEKYSFQTLMVNYYNGKRHRLTTYLAEDYEEDMLWNTTGTRQTTDSELNSLKELRVDDYYTTYLSSKEYYMNLPNFTLRRGKRKRTKTHFPGMVEPSGYVHPPAVDNKGKVQVGKPLSREEQKKQRNYNRRFKKDDILDETKEEHEYEGIDPRSDTEEEENENSSEEDQIHEPHTDNYEEQESEYDSNEGYAEAEDDSEDEFNDPGPKYEYYFKGQNKFPEFINLPAMKKGQREDVILGTILKTITDNNGKQLKYDDYNMKWCKSVDKTQRRQIINKQFTVNRNGLLMFHSDGEQNWKRICLPMRFARRITMYYHQILDHQKKRITEEIKQDFYWPKMDEDILEIMMSCRNCQKVTGRRNIKHGMVTHFEPPSTTFEALAIDLVGPLPSQIGYKYILTCVDLLSNFIIAEPIKNMYATTVLDTLWTRVILPHGIPRTILSDRGTQFTGILNKWFERILGFKSLLTVSYHPQTNGRIERWHRYLKQRLCLRSLDMELDYFGVQFPNEWKDQLPAIVSIYNKTPSPTIGNISPFQCVYGKTYPTTASMLLHGKIKGMADYKKIFSMRAPVEDQGNIKKFVARIAKNIALIQMVAGHFRKETNKKTASRINKNKKHITYKKGDEILYYQRDSQVGNQRKLLPAFQDDWIIQKKISKNRYLLKNRKTNASKEANVDQMKKVIVLRNKRVFQIIKMEAEDIAALRRLSLARVDAVMIPGTRISKSQL